MTELSTTNMLLDSVDHHGDIQRLETVVGKSSLTELCESVSYSFGIGLRLVSITDEVLAETIQKASSDAIVLERQVTYEGQVVGQLVVTSKPDGLSLEKVETLCDHIQNVMELLIFAGQRAHMASRMHIASVGEHVRVLETKNRELHDAYHRLVELDRLKSNFLATVSHELKTPLTSILGYNEILEFELADKLSDDHREFLQIIKDRGTDLLGLIGDLIDSSKLEQGSIELRQEAYSPAKLLDEVAKTVSPKAKKRGLEIVIACEEELPPVWIDVLRARQVFTNLVDNAIKFTPRGGRVELSATKLRLDGGASSKGGALALFSVHQPRIRFRVSDTGIGIPEAAQSAIFDAFYQVDNSETRDHEGAGLGLSIVKRLVEAHGGDIWVESRPQEGTSFFLELPSIPSTDRTDTRSETDRT